MALKDSPVRLFLRSRVVEIALIATVVAVYFGTWNNPFVFDDMRSVVANPSLRDPNNLVFALVFERFRPLTNLSYFLEYRLWGLDAAGYHATNIALHAANSVLVYRLFCRLDGCRTEQRSHFAAVVALVFAAHPMATSAVGYISARSELLAAFFVLASLIAFCSGWERQSKGLVALGWVLWAFALFTKESGAVVPLLLLSFNRCGLLPGSGSRRLRSFYFPAGLLVTTGFVLRMVAYSGESSSPGLGGIVTHWLLETEIGWRYLCLFLLPYGQSLVHEVSDQAGGWSIVAALVSTVVLGTAIGVKRIPWSIRLGILWFMVALVPSAIAPLSEFMAEHRTYLAGPGLFLVLVGGARVLAELLQARGFTLAKHVAAGVSVAVILALGAGAIARNDVWRDDVLLWTDAAAKTPRVYVTHAAAGQALQRHGDCEKAIAYYRTALSLLPERTESLVNMGTCMAKLRRYDEAQDVFIRVIELAPNNVHALNNLAQLALIRGETTTARDYYQRVLNIDPNNNRARQALELSTSSSPP
ncbi:MAG: hypothetical protein A2341_18175 [Deltaproteobacteria bacterium RIFOXYB12_FULL_58_9]|nr:MAG: hypothetical protein A2341_18175 [Deltaproteobacteria bacterium RIFOXYB12_FULL_58_9]